MDIKAPGGGGAWGDNSGQENQTSVTKKRTCFPNQFCTYFAEISPFLSKMPGGHIFFGLNVPNPLPVTNNKQEKQH